MLYTLGISYLHLTQVLQWKNISIIIILKCFITFSTVGKKVDVFYGLWCQYLYKQFINKSYLVENRWNTFNSSVNNICFRTENAAFLDRSYCMPCGTPILGRYLSIQKQSDIKILWDSNTDLSEIDVTTGILKAESQSACP